jgi:hypothetical protein
MTTATVTRRLAAILVADVVGYRSAGVGGKSRRRFARSISRATEFGPHTPLTAVARGALPGGRSG